MHPSQIPILFVVGASARTAPLGLRERMALCDEGQAALARDLSALPWLQEHVILCTCNRAEVYGVATGRDAAERVARMLCERQGVPADAFASHGFLHHDREAIRHLMEVASGLDSQVLGETEILGQAKRAYEAAQERGSVGAILNRLFQKTFQAAKRARSDTGLSSGQVSHANLAVDLASTVFGDLSRARVLVLGAGKVGEKSARAFASRGAGSISVCSRAHERASALASQVGAEVVPLSEFEARLQEWDVVVCATSAPGTVLSASAVRQAMRARGARPMLLLDLAMPRDVEASAADAGSVFLYNLDDLAALSERHRLARLQEAARARLILAPRAEALWQRLRDQMSAPRGAPALSAPSPRAAPALALA